jgi:hypothetical protein
MRKYTILAIVTAAVLTAACATAPTVKPVNGPTDLSPQPVTLGAEPTTVNVRTETPAESATGVPSDALSGDIPNNPLDLIGRLRTALLGSQRARDILIRDASIALKGAQAANEQDGMTCFPAIIKCAQDGPDVCFADNPAIGGLLSLIESRINGTSFAQFLLPKDVHQKCSAWALTAVAKAGALGRLR